MLKSDACRVAGFFAVLSFLSSSGRLLLLFLSACMVWDCVKKSLLPRNNFTIFRHVTLIYSAHTRFQTRQSHPSLIVHTTKFIFPYLLNAFHHTTLLNHSLVSLTIKTFTLIALFTSNFDMIACLEKGKCSI